MELSARELQELHAAPAALSLLTTTGSVILFFGDWIKTAAAPGMAAAYTFHCEPSSTHRSESFHSLHGILRACRSEAARGRKMRRNGQLIETYRRYRQFPGNLFSLHARSPAPDR